MKLYFFIIAAFLATTINAQNCKVDLPEINESYEGECKSGKADGIGIAKGKVDKYEGQFTKGKPNGRGTYTWADGHYYVGEWKNGIKEGQGEMHYKTTEGNDSLITGTWKKDKQIANEKPYDVLLKTQNITKLQVTNTTSNDNQIVFEISNTSAGLGAMTSGSTSPMKVTDFQILQGVYTDVVQSNTANKSITRIINPVFPFRIRLSFSNESLDILFKEKKNWNVKIEFNL